MYTDGLREPGRDHPRNFALEQVEITKGPSSTFAGRGSTGGRSITSPRKPAWTIVSAVWKAAWARTRINAVVDTSQLLSEDLAIRFNALYHDADIPNRSPASEERSGALLSGRFPGHRRPAGDRRLLLFSQR
ncbi:MAG: hypothetical protein R3F53_03905 [Gammaproteobacteria bacterium]